MKKCEPKTKANRQRRSKKKIWLYCDKRGGLVKIPVWKAAKLVAIVESNNEL